MKKDILGLGHGGPLGIILKPSHFQKTTKIYKNVNFYREPVKHQQ